ncbi:hypothetical protein FGO68_gene9900 [Halteria grandinella]|uniref:Uncharacterized protein n=1 Tax=Halteria grandinella TaxID=5974 RepID=A0A8J8SWE8_HALGN|nr:hypothetical protein FGO68_gene9900 [Halteria grandinella]
MQQKDLRNSLHQWSQEKQSNQSFDTQDRIRPEKLGCAKNTQFSDHIIIMALKNEKYDILKTNLDLLSKHFLWAIYNLPDYQHTEFSFVIADQNLSFLFTMCNSSYMHHIEELKDEKLEHFIKFLDHVKTFKLLHFQGINFSINRLDNKALIDQNLNDSTWRRQAAGNIVLKQTISLLKSISLENSNFYGDYTQKIPNLYPQKQKYQCFGACDLVIKPNLGITHVQRRYVLQTVKLGKLKLVRGIRLSIKREMMVQHVKQFSISLAISKKGNSSSLLKL